MRPSPPALRAPRRAAAAAAAAARLALRTLLVSSAWLVATATLASAQEPGSAEAAAEAKRLFGQARELHESGLAREAIDRLDEAYSLYPVPPILLTLVNRHLDLGELEEARGRLDGVDLSTWDAGQKAQHAKALERVLDHLAKPVSVLLVADAPDAVVRVDGGLAKPLPAEVVLSRGVHRFDFTAPLRHPVELAKEIRGAGPVKVSVAMTPAVGRYRVAIEPSGEADLKDVRLLLKGRQVLLDGEERAAGVTRERELAPGEYRVVCLRGLKERAEARFVVRDGESTTAVCAFSPPPSRGPDLAVPAWVTLGVGVAAAVAGGILLGDWLDKEARFGGITDNDGNPRYDVDPTFGYLGAGLVGAGVLSGITSGVLFALDD